MPTKATGRKKKKMVLVEVEVSDEEEVEHSQQSKSVAEPCVELESSDNAVEASDVQDQFISNQNAEIDNCSNTAQFPEDSDHVTNELNSFKGALSTTEGNDASNNVDFVEVIENDFCPGELQVQEETQQDDTLDSQSTKHIRVRSQKSLFGEKESFGDSESISNQDDKVDMNDKHENENKMDKQETMDNYNDVPAAESENIANESQQSFNPQEESMDIQQNQSEGDLTNETEQDAQKMEVNEVTTT